MTFWQLIIREIKAIATDKAIALTLFGGVIFYSILYPLPYLNEVPTKQPIVVVDLDHSSLSRELIEHANASPKLLVTAQVGSITAAQQLISESKAHGLLVIPANFKRDLLTGKGVTLAYAGDASYFLIYSDVIEGLVTVGMDLNQQIQLKSLLAHGQSRQQAEQTIDPIHLNSVPVFNKILGYTPYVVPGLFLLILHQTLLIGGAILGAGQWRKQGYWSDVGAVKLVCGRICAFSIIYLFFSSFYVGYCYYLYEVSLLANAITIGLLMLPFILATAACGLALSCLFTRRDLPTQVVLLASMPILFVSGFVWPISLIPEPLVWLSQIVPAIPAIMAMLKLNQLGADWSVILPLWLHLWLLFAIYFALACYGFTRHKRQQFID